MTLGRPAPLACVPPGQVFLPFRSTRPDPVVAGFAQYSCDGETVFALLLIPDKRERHRRISGGPTASAGTPSALVFPARNLRLSLLDLTTRQCLRFHFQVYFCIDVRRHKGDVPQPGAEDVTRALHETGSLPGDLKSEGLLTKLMRAPKPRVADSLGHAGDGPASPIWRRWKITYAGGLATFETRMQEIAAAEKRLRVRPEDLE